VLRFASLFKMSLALRIHINQLYERALYNGDHVKHKDTKRTTEVSPFDGFKCYPFQKSVPLQASRQNPQRLFNLNFSKTTPTHSTQQPQYLSGFHSAQMSYSRSTMFSEGKSQH